MGLVSFPTVVGANENSVNHGVVRAGQARSVGVSDYAIHLPLILSILPFGFPPLVEVIR